MKKILFQSDDFGITPGVVDGTIRAIKDGIVRNTGLFVNMPTTKEAVEKIKEVDVCLGIDINLVSGKPVSPPELVSSLVNEKGYFKSSKDILASYEFISIDGIVSKFKEDPYNYEEVLLEIENQVKYFIELTGKVPEYLSPHSLATANTERAAIEVAKKYNIYRLVDFMNDSKYKQLPGFLVLSKDTTVEDQLNYNVTDHLLKNAFPELIDGEISYYIFHCGFVDYELFENSSLTLRRMKDLEAATNVEIMDYIKRNDIELISYRDIINN